MPTDSSNSEDSSDMEEEEEEEESQESISGHEEENEMLSASQPEQEQPQPLARDHSYLDASHPLLPENPSFLSGSNQWQGGTSSIDNKDDNSFFARTFQQERKDPFQLAILELRGVVLFPGSSIPIKLQNKSMIRYLGRQIQLCRTHPELQPKVELGIMAQQEETFLLDMPIVIRRLADGRIVRDGDMRVGNARFRIFQRGNQYQAPTPQNNRYAEPQSSEIRQDPYIGRIGTIATVRHTHERTDNTRPTVVASSSVAGSSSLWTQYEDVNELVLTAVGTSRFRIVDVVNDDSNSTRGNIFMVEELKDDAMARPVSIMKPFSSGNITVGCYHDDTEEITEDDYSANSTDGGAVTTSKISRQSLIAWNLSQVTPVPYHIHNRFSPWSLMGHIMDALQTNAGSNNLPSLGADGINRKHLEPTRFSFWIANNAPFTEAQRLELLSMHSTLERLLMIWKEIEKMTAKPLVICCNTCTSILSFTKDVFTVGGAEGSTSAYVNAAGYIHQITTLRDLIDENRVFFDGQPSTHNSYFPGYSWHITLCRRCESLLGWKFRKVCSESIESPDRPGTFFGFMSSNVITRQLT
jgi:hypothetical protein